MSNKQNDQPLSAPPPFAGWRRAARVIALALLAVGIAVAWHSRAVLEPQMIGAAIGRHPTAPLAFLAIHIAASLLFVPRTVLAVAAGLVFGISWGIVWAAIGSVLGAIAGFTVARHITFGVLDLEANAWIRPALNRIEGGGWRAVALLRLVPIIPHSLANYGLGLTPVALAPYAFGSLIGQLPMTIACVDLGAAGERLALGRAGWIAPTVIGAAALALSLVIPAIARRRA